VETNRVPDYKQNPECLVVRRGFTKKPGPRSAPSFLSGGRARVPSRRDLSVWPIMPGAGFLALRVLADVAEESGNRVRV
jgi:hypothetical protein